MRERERLEREREGEKDRRGYIHKVDQSSISFFVTNFPDDCHSADLWKLFASYGRLGDVYIPNKVDKWGKRFAFVKFRDEIDAVELGERLEDVWLGTFKLRVNVSRFGRKEDDNRKKELGDHRKKELLEGESSSAGRSFKDALVKPKNDLKQSCEEVKKVIPVDVDGNIMKELEESFVGRLAVNVEVYRIRTILFMEGLAHIVVTDMGRNMVLIHSPKVGEIERLWKSRADWITYYFREVYPWSPSCYADRRDTWVKVFGIPLHVWGDNLFKAIGGMYGEFLDYDNNTASRAKLDVACLKISTSFRGNIDDYCIFRPWE
jgi:RNA recognition motif-containing protein